MKQNYIVTERPDDMDYEVYKAIKNQQKKALKEYKKGKLFKSSKKKNDD